MQSKRVEETKHTIKEIAKKAGDRSFCGFRLLANRRVPRRTRGRELPRAETRKGDHRLSGAYELHTGTKAMGEYEGITGLGKKSNLRG